MADHNSRTSEELTENDLNDVQGGIALLLPAVQKVREAARKTERPTEEVAFYYNKIK